MRFRLLPVVILLAAISLGMKVEGLWSGVSAMTAEKAQSLAKSLPSSLPSPNITQLAALDAQAQEIESQESDADEVLETAQKNEADEEADKAENESAEAAAQTADLPADPFAMTDEEIELLQALSKRRKEIDQRERDVEGREALLAAAEKRVDEKVKRLEDLQRKIERLLVKYDEQEEKQFANLVSIYEKMKPKEAARIFNQLEMEVLLKVIERMNQRRSAPVLAQMAPNVAKEVTMELANRRDLPLPRN
ncbi:MotE family protein [Rhodovibrionaceae bacterium A322]